MKGIVAFLSKVFCEGQKEGERDREREKQSHFPRWFFASQLKEAFSIVLEMDLRSRHKPVYKPVGSVRRAFMVFRFSFYEWYQRWWEILYLADDESTNSTATRAREQTSERASSSDDGTNQRFAKGIFRYEGRWRTHLVIVIVVVVVVVIEISHAHNSVSLSVARGK